MPGLFLKWPFTEMLDHSILHRVIYSRSIGRYGHIICTCMYPLCNRRAEIPEFVMGGFLPL